MAEFTNRSSWDDEDTYWQNNYRNRPYASKTASYDTYQPGYRYGYEAANRYTDRSWTDVEPELSKSWNTYPHRGNSTWEQIKDAARDAWDRVTGHRHVGTR